jgi:hypothetical protein
LLAATALPGGGFGSTASAASCAGVKHAGHWDTIALPAAASYTPAATAVAQVDSNTYPLVATSRRTGDITVTDAARTGLWHSPDGGCTWKQSFSLGDVGGYDGAWLTDLDYQFSSLAVADAAGARPVLYAAAVPYSGTGQDVAIATQHGSFGFVPSESTLRLFVFVSRDGGATWKPAVSDATPADLQNEALHPACMNGSLAAAVDQSSAVFIHCNRHSGDGTSVLYASSDAAAHWTVPAAKNIPPTPYMPASGFAIGVDRGTTLWMPGNITETPKNQPPKTYVTMYHSADRGVSWQATAMRADKVCDVNSTGWLVQTATSGARGKTIAMWSPAALLRSTNGGLAWKRAAPFTNLNDRADYEGAAIAGPDDATTYAIGAWPPRSDDWNTNFRPWDKDLRTRHVLLMLTRRAKWQTIGAVPVAANSTLLQVQSGWWHGTVVYGLALIQSSANARAFVAKILRYRP